jgi:hypothetical protein
VAKIRSFPNNQDEYIGAEDVMRWLHGRSSGVFGADRNAAVYGAVGMAVSVSDGNGWLTNANGDGVVWWIDNDAKNGQMLNLPIDMADAALPRIDRVVVSWQTTDYVALPEVVILKGTPASNPVPPALTNDSMVRQISLARIRIPAGATSVDSSMITDERLDSSVCGIVTEQVGVDTSMMQAQFESFMNKTIEEQNAYIEAQAQSWEAFFANVQKDTVVPVPTTSDKGKIIKVNPTGDGYTLGGVTIPVSVDPPEDSDFWFRAPDAEGGEITEAYLMYKNPVTGEWHEVPSQETIDNLVSDMKHAISEYGTEDLTAGVSPLETGKLYFVYE